MERTKKIQKHKYKFGQWILMVPYPDNTAPQPPVTQNISILVFSLSTKQKPNKAILIGNWQIPENAL